HLARHGRDSLEQALEAQAAALEDRFQSLQPEERAQLARLCMKLESSPTPLASSPQPQ
ncbi:MAG: hypothetical protein GWO81_03825, partial [Verrucomicrobia bacterium]|nr:hypothetical protein [Verrucomicrobiota bacterium]